MAYIPLQIPPGVYRNGTELQSAGRWFDANLVRWKEGSMRPVGGWRKRSNSTMTGKARGMITWRTNAAERYIGIGTHSGLYVSNTDGAIKNITPTGFTSGYADAVVPIGYGYGAYGSYAYGVVRPDIGNVIPATTWALDTWGEYLVGCSNFDGKIYEWQIDFSTPTVAAQIANSPTSCQSMMVTAERFVFALGAGGNPRKVAWCDQENNTSWTPSTSNQAGDYEIATTGRLMAGKRVRGVNLLFTDTDVHQSQYIGQPYVYNFEKIGSGCGLISQQAVAAVDTMAVWMSRSGFWMFDGYVKPLPSDVSDYVYRNLNTSQASKIYAVHNSAFREIWWYYPSATSNEVDSYVSFNYQEGHWSIGTMSRTCGTDSGVFVNPLLVSVDGYIYEHEVGFDYDSAIQFAESGPVQIGIGDNLMSARQLVPDELTQGEVSMTFKTKFYPNGEETSFGPYTMSNPTDVRFTARQVKMRVESHGNDSWRLGIPRLEAVQGGKR